MLRLFFTAAIALTSANILSAQDAPPAPETESTESLFERRIAERAAGVVKKVTVANADVSSKVQKAVTQFYRGLNAAHTDRDRKLTLLATVDNAQLHRIYHNADKRTQAVYGELIGTLSPVLDDAQIEAVKDGMTFDMVPLSIASYQRMFPKLSARQKEQLRLWLVASREIAIVAGSAETKLDVFRVNKKRAHAYLAAQGFDVDTAVKAEEARKAAENKTP